MNLTSTISLLETVWTGMAVIASIWNVRELQEALHDIRAVRAQKTNSGFLLIAQSHVHMSIVHLFVQFAFGLAGVLAMLRPSAPGGASILSTLVSMVFVMAEASLLYRSWYVNRLRRRLKLLLTLRT